MPLDSSYKQKCEKSLPLPHIAAQAPLIIFPPPTHWSKKERNFISFYETDLTLLQKR